MTALRYLAVVRDRHAPPQPNANHWLDLCALGPSATAHVHGRLMAVASGSPTLAIGNGLILGALFDRRCPAPVTSPTHVDGGLLLASHGTHLLEQFWGGYVAFLHDADADRVDVLRAPMGELPCFKARIAGAWLFASDMELLIRAGVRTGICWSEVARELVWPFLRSGHTCIAGIEAVPVGHRVTLARDATTTMLWSPWDFVAADPNRAEIELAERLRRVVDTCVQARAASFDTIQLLLSGGLDSSIVLACLRRRDPPPELLTLYTSDLIGDERDYSATMAQAAELPLREALRRTEDVDPAWSEAARLPWPSSRLFDQATWRQLEAAGRENGAQATLTGGGGDNVFCSLQSAAPVADRILSRSTPKNIYRTARDISQIAPAGLPQVAIAAMKRTFPRRRRSPLASNPAYLSDVALDLAGRSPPAHPWLDLPKGGLPGKSAHVTMLAIAQGFAEGYDPQASMPVIHPLLAQPIVEICLSVPSWFWVNRGMDRALARRAFADVLPVTIAQRRTKGSPECFVGEIYERHHAQIASMLLDGILWKEGLLDRSAVAQAVRGGAIAPPDVSELMRLLDVEAWLRCRSASL